MSYALVSTSCVLPQVLGFPRNTNSHILSPSRCSWHYITCALCPSADSTISLSTAITAPEYKAASHYCECPEHGGESFPDNLFSPHETVRANHNWVWKRWVTHLVPGALTTSCCKGGCLWEGWHSSFSKLGFTVIPRHSSVMSKEGGEFSSMQWVLVLAPCSDSPTHTHTHWYIPIYSHWYIEQFFYKSQRKFGRPPHNCLYYFSKLNLDSVLDTKRKEHFCFTLWHR